MFEIAAREKIRFNTVKGVQTVEDLFDIPLVAEGAKLSLDQIAIDLFQQLKDEGVTSFVLKEKPANSQLQLKFDIVKHIIKVRLAEKEATEKTAELKRRKQQIMALISQKENEALASSSIEELRGMLEQL